MAKTVTITVIDDNNQEHQIIKTFSGNTMPVDLDNFIKDHVGERPTREEPR